MTARRNRNICSIFSEVYMDLDSRYRHRWFMFYFLIMPYVDDWWGVFINYSGRELLDFSLGEFWWEYGTGHLTAGAIEASHYWKSCSSPEVCFEFLFLIILEWNDGTQKHTIHTLHTSTIRNWTRKHLFEFLLLHLFMYFSLGKNTELL